MRLPLARQYRSFQNYASANWPFLWRMRLDAPVLFGAIALALVMIAPYPLKALLYFVGSGWRVVAIEYYYAILFLLIIILCGGAAAYWLFLINRLLPVREIPAFSNSPRYTYILLGLTFLAIAPFLFPFRLIWAFVDAGMIEPQLSTILQISYFYLGLVTYVASFIKITRLTSLAKTFKALGLLVVYFLLAVLLGVIFEPGRDATDMQRFLQFVAVFGALSAPLFAIPWIFSGRHKRVKFEFLANFIFWSLPFAIPSLVFVILVLIVKIVEWSGSKRPIMNVQQYWPEWSAATTEAVIATAVIGLFLVIFEIYFAWYSRSTLRPQR